MAKGNLTGIKKWASTTGWDEDQRLAPLIPSGEVPVYSQSQLPKNDTVPISNNVAAPISPILPAIAAIAIGSFFGYRFYANRKRKTDDSRSNNSYEGV